LGKLPWWQQSLYGTAIDYGYEVNKSNATPQSVKAEMIGSGAGVAVSGISELGSKIEPRLNGINKIIFNVIGGDKISDYIKEEAKEVE
ncbi:hypothetical protein, partial [Bibersteinia trehalosi]|uniref:hypothetical protein n=1 Tax=Bibersteinia trehalosi TaxID=47735 RepID=UPI00163AAC8E